MTNEAIKVEKPEGPEEPEGVQEVGGVSIEDALVAFIRNINVLAGDVSIVLLHC